MHQTVCAADQSPAERAFVQAERGGHENTAALQEAIDEGAAMEEAAAVEAEAGEAAAAREAPDNLPVVSCIKSSKPSHNPVPTA